ncbi:MAG: protease inhibitor I42 family protein [Actinomycetia bacterium]|nr:protease inhibitor I42 family protein [Actinomycetes bacterium]
MAKRYAGTIVIVILLAAFALCVGLASPASAARWNDLDEATVGLYGVSLDGVSRLSSGFPDETWRPWQSISRAQFAKMAATAFALEPAAPERPTFSDVDAADDYYPYIEAVSSAGLVKGVGGSRFDPMATLTREQAVAVVARHTAVDRGYDLAGLSEEEISVVLGGFRDGTSVSPGLRAELAFAVANGIVLGTGDRCLVPQSPMTRIGAAAILIRATQPTPYVLDENDDGATVTLEVGDILKVALRGNPTTGYSWTVTQSDEAAAILESVGGPYYVPDTGLIGSGGVFTFVFKAVSPGEATLSLAYSRPWEDVPPSETFSVTVLVQAGPVDGAIVLDGTSWRLQAWPVSALDARDFEITASFEDGRVGGKAAVNLYSAPYTADAGGAFGVGEIVSTKMAGPEAAMRAESWYFELLRQACSYRLDADGLTLFGEDGAELLRFVATAE